MRRIMAALALLACGAAQADTGPLYVSYPGYCNVKRIYMNNLGDIYGQEIGCSGIIGAPMLGFIHPNGSFIFSAQDGSGRACMHNYLPTGVISAGCSNGVTTDYPPLVPYIGSVTPPPRSAAKSVTPGGSTELPRLPF